MIKIFLGKLGVDRVVKDSPSSVYRAVRVDTNSEELAMLVLITMKYTELARTFVCILSYKNRGLKP